MVPDEVEPQPRRHCAVQKFRVDPNLLGSLDEGEAFVIAQRRAHLVRVARRSIPEVTLRRAAEMLNPKVQVERLSPDTVTPSKQSELKRAIDW